MPSSRQKLAAALLAGMLLLHAVARIAAAATGGQITLPLPSPTGMPAPNKSGLTISVDTVWLPANGYRPVRITITPVVPPASDRALQIRLTPIGERPWELRPGVQVTRMTDIPAGSSGAATTISVPQWAPWQALQLDVFEDGKRIDELSASNVMVSDDVSSGHRLGTAQPALGESPTVLGLDAPTSFMNAPLFRRGIEFLFVDPGQLPYGAPSVPPAPRLPTHWLNYCGVDVVLVPVDKLDDLAKNYPSQWEAVRNAIAAGGNLCVYAVGEHWEQLAKLEEFVDFGPQTPGNGETVGSPSLRGWKKADPRPQSPPSDTSVSGAPADAAGPTLPAPFLSRALGRGQIVAISADIKSAGGNLDWDWLLSTIGENRWQWTARSGVVLDPAELQSNASNFWQFLIPGVGLTPVLQFQILISLFVIAIGPVNYYLLRRWQRLNLMPITVGVGATLVTLSLFAYAFIHDGLGVRVRARSFTELDQRRGEAVCWSRLSYYAGLSPSKGLTFSGETAVYPLRIGSEQASMDRQKPSAMEMEWIEAEPNAADSLPSQHFSSDWLPARVPTQFVTVRARKTAARLNVIVGPQGGISKIENRLGARILSLVVTDSAGKTFAAEGVREDASATLTALESSDARANIAKLILENDLQFPTGAQSSVFQTSQGYSRYSNMSRYGMGGNVATPAEAETILERSLHHASDLPPRSFVAITETSPEVELGTPAAHEESSLHVVIGRW